MRDNRTGGGKKARPIHVAALRQADQLHKRQRQREKKIAAIKEQRAATHTGHSFTGGRSLPVEKSAQLGGEVYSAAARRRDLRLLARRSKQIQTGGYTGGGSVSGFLEAGGFGIPVSTIRHPIRSIQGQHHTIDLQKTANVKGATNLAGSLVLGGLHTPKGIAKAGLEAHPARKAFHENIDKTVADPKMAAKMKKTFDVQTLRAAKRAGVGPGEYLDKAKQTPEAQKVIAGLSAGRAQTLRKEKTALQHEERSRRAGVGSEALRQSPGSAGIKAAKQELRGALPNPEYQGLRNLTDNELEALLVHTTDHPDLRFYEKMHVADALRAAREGTVPTDYDRGLIRKAFGPEFDQAMMDGRSLGQKARHVAIETANIPRAVMSSGDVSGVGRQNIVAMARHPVITSRNLKPMMKSLVSETHYADRRRALESKPYYEEGKSHGLALTDVEHSLANREEPFQSNYAEKIPGVGRVVRGSGRAFTDLSANNRYDIYEWNRKLMDKQGHPGDPKALRDLTGYINSATGRGSLGRFEKSAVGMNAVFFSPRLVSARLDFLMPQKYFGLDPYVRKQKLRAAAQFGAMLSGMLALADQVPGVDVGVDPRSTDFGKIRIGDTRLDFTGGFQQYARIAVQLALNQKINPATGQAEKGKSLDTFWKFVRAKFSPTTGLAVDIGTRTQYSGQPLNWKSEIGSRAFPLGVQDAFTIYQNTGSLPGAIAGYGASAIGAGIQSYKPQKGLYPGYAGPGYKGFNKELGAALKKINADMPPYLRGRLKMREERANQSKKAGKTSADHFAADITLLVKYGAIPGKEARGMVQWARGLPDDKLNHAKISKARSYLTRTYFDPNGELSAFVKALRESGNPNLYLPK